MIEIPSNSNWFIPENLSIFEKELENELTISHSLFGCSLKAVAKNELNDDVLFTDNINFYIIHLTWSVAGDNIYPKYKKISQNSIKYILNNTTLAFRIYPLPNGTNYGYNELANPQNVISIFDYCQILEAVITKAGWNFLIDYYGYNKLFKINNKSDWLDCSNIDEFILEIQNQIDMSPT